MNLNERSAYNPSRPSSYESPQVKSHTRRPHRKTKTGCLVCKRRKIKCDESRPECSNCIKHSLSCEFAPPKTSILSSSGYRDKLAANGPNDLNLVDLELFHHFCTSTAFTINLDPTMCRLWSNTIPVLGLRHDFVMHSILALGALHIAHLNLEKRDIFTGQAMMHHKAGLAKATPALMEFAEENASAMYLFSALTCLYTYATLRQTDESVLGGKPGVAEWIVLSRQSFSIVRMADETLQTGPLGPMFKAGERRSRLRDQVSYDTFSGAKCLRRLSALITENTPDPRTEEAYRTAIEDLLKIFNVVFAMPMEMRESSDVFGWPFRLTDGYLELLQQPTQEALVILAYFSVLPELLGSKWWLEGFGRHLFSKIYPLINDEHLAWIQWPLDQLGWSPDEAKHPRCR
ncbi:hypothetical protein DL95DRAFT_371997 [Leptodontidium sp. 2 PMI_412]|nr:hypothetical protein DL95DRAFT_371997 [Leptodontidium sp. 2 PMI_412]